MAKLKRNIKKLPAYPPDHKLGMEVPNGGSNCAKCSFWDGDDCENKTFREWNGSGDIPVAPERYCCDFWMPKDKK